MQLCSVDNAVPVLFSDRIPLHTITHNHQHSISTWPRNSGSVPSPQCQSPKASGSTSLLEAHRKNSTSTPTLRLRLHPLPPLSIPSRVTRLRPATQLAATNPLCITSIDPTFHSGPMVNSSTSATPPPSLLDVTCWKAGEN